MVSITILAIVLMLMFLISLSYLSVYGVSESDLVYPVGSKPFGLPYANWSELWWQWALSIPGNESLVNDKTGEFCSIGQDNPNVFFLAGSGGGAVERTCTVPAGKGILIPVLNAEYSYAEFPDLKTESDLRNAVHADMDGARNMRLIVDGVGIKDPSRFRVDSHLFNFSTPQGGLFGLNDVDSQGVSDGYYVMLKGLKPGSHDVRWSGIVFFADGTNQPEDTTYHLTVK
jgi:hypothetical protein